MSLFYHRVSHATNLKGCELKIFGSGDQISREICRKTSASMHKCRVVGFVILRKKSCGHYGEDAAEDNANRPRIMSGPTLTHNTFRRNAEPPSTLATGIISASSNFMSLLKHDRTFLVGPHTSKQNETSNLVYKRLPSTTLCISIPQPQHLSSTPPDWISTPTPKVQASLTPTILLINRNDDCHQSLRDQGLAHPSLSTLLAIRFGLACLCP